MKKILSFLVLSLLIFQVGFASAALCGRNVVHQSKDSCECDWDEVLCYKEGTGYACMGVRCSEGWTEISGTGGSSGSSIDDPSSGDDPDDPGSGSGTKTPVLNWGEGEEYVVNLGGGDVKIYNGDLAGLAEAILEFIRNIALALVPLVIVLAGIKFATADGNPQKIEEAKKIIMWAGIGLIIVLIAEGIILTIQGFIS